MKKTIAKLMFIALTAALFGCGGSQTTVVTAGQMHPAGSWDGVFHSAAYGRMEFTQSGSQVVGLFESERNFGRIEGTIDGDILRFQFTDWKEDLNGKVRSQTGNGYFKYVVKEEGTTKKHLAHFLYGEWGYGEARTGNKWDAVKLPDRAKKTLQPRDVGETTSDMDKEYSQSAGLLADQPSGDQDTGVKMSSPGGDDKDDDGADSLDGLF